MKKLFARVLTAGIICSALALAACGGAGGGASNGGGATATATPKPAPTGVPTLTVAKCEQLLSLAEANQIMNPSKPATMVELDGTATCGYDYAQNQAVVGVTFLPYTGTAAEAMTMLTANEDELKQSTDSFTATPIPGLGTAALFEGYTQDSITAATVNVVDGKVIITCHNFEVGSTPLDFEQTALTKVCTTVISRM